MLSAAFTGTVLFSTTILFDSAMLAIIRADDSMYVRSAARPFVEEIETTAFTICPIIIRYCKMWYNCTWWFGMQDTSRSPCRGRTFLSAYLHIWRWGLPRGLPWERSSRRRGFCPGTVLQHHRVQARWQTNKITTAKSVTYKRINVQIFTKETPF